MSDKYADSVANAISTAQAWKYASFLLGAVSLALAFFLIQASRNTPVVLIPYGVATSSSKMVVSGNQPGATSPAYYSEIAMADLSMILDVTPDDVKTQYQRFLTRLTPDLYGRQNAALMGEAQNLRSQGITQSFYPLRIVVDPQKAQVTVSGEQVQYLGGTETSRSNISYVVTYQETHGYLLISDLRQQS